MCIRASEVYPPLCDYCLAIFVKMQEEGKEIDESIFCEVCQETLKHWCGSCDALYEDEIVIDGVCKKCREEF